MSNIVDNIDRLLKERGLSASRMCVDLGMSRSFLTELRSGRAKMIKADTAQKVAQYLGVSVETLLADPKEFTDGDRRDIARDLETFAQSLSDGDLMFDGDPLTPEARESILAAIKLGLEAAKARNKDTYGKK